MSAKTVIELWLWGGPSQLETFDPKPDAGADYNNGLKAIPTNVPGMSVHEWCPELAKCADLYSLVRTMTHPHFGHETATYLMQTGRNPGGGDVYPAIGAVIAMMKEKEYKGDLPPFVILTNAKGRFSEIGFLGERYAPLVTGGDPNAKTFVVDGIVPPGGLGPEAVRRRFELLADVDAFDVPGAFADFEAAGRAARHVIEGDAAKTFDLGQEPPEVRDRYGRTWIGQTLLAARRLVEYGVPYVTVNMSGWDSHKRHFETMRQKTLDTDRAIAALLRDLADRKLLDTTILWVSGEFGRTTKINRDAPWNGGRNHYPKCFSALVAGGGFRGGCVVGESDATAANVVKRPVTPVDFLGSIYELCGIDPDGPMPNPVGKKLTILPPQSKAGRLRELYRHLLVPLVCAGLAALSPRAATAAPPTPYVGYLSPAGLAAGTTNRIVVGGQFLQQVRAGVVSGKGVKVLKIEHVPNFPPPFGGQRKYLVSWLRGIAKGNPARPVLEDPSQTNEWRQCAWWKRLDELDPLELSLVERDLFTKRNALQMSPALRQKAIVTVAVDAGAAPGAREFRLCGPNGMSPPRPLLVTSEPHRAEPRFAPPYRPEPETPVVDAFPAVLDGTILPGETDVWTLRLRKGQAVTLRTTARELQPYVGDAVPGFFNAALRIADGKGRELAFADDNVYHPDPVLTFVAPADGDYALEIHDVLYRGREDFVYAIEICEGRKGVSPAAAVLWPKPDAAIPADALVATFRGVLKTPGATAEHAVEIPAAGLYGFDLLARRRGSPLDGKVEVLDGDGRTLATFSDVTNAVFCGSIIQGELDSVGQVFLPAGKCRVRVSDEAGKGGGLWTYELRVHRPAPRFEVWLSRSSFPLKPGIGAKAKAFVFRRDGFAGDVRLEPNAFVKFEPSVLPAASNVVEVTVVPTAKGPVPPQAVDVFATADFCGWRKRTKVVPADEYNQAFAWDHLLPSRSFWVGGAFGGKNGKGWKKNRNGQSPKSKNRKERRKQP